MVLAKWYNYTIFPHLDIFYDLYKINQSSILDYQIFSGVYTVANVAVFFMFESF